MKKTFMILFILLFASFVVADTAPGNDLSEINRISLGNTPLYMYYWFQSPGIEDQTDHITVLLLNQEGNTLNDVDLHFDMGNGEEIDFNFPSIQPYEIKPVHINTIYGQGGDYLVLAIVTYNGDNENFEHTFSITEVNDVPSYLTFDIVEDEIEVGETANVVSTFSDEEDESLFLGISLDSSMENCNVDIQSGCFDYVENAINGESHSFDTSSLEEGTYTFYSQVCDSENECDGILEDNLEVVAGNEPPTYLTFDVIEDSVSLGDMINTEGTFTDDDDELFYGVSSSSSMDNCNLNDQSGCLCYDSSTPSPASCDFDSTLLGGGEFQIYSWVCDSVECSSILSDSVIVEEPISVTGIVMDLFTDEPLSGATITFEDVSGDVSDVTDSNGEYSVVVYSHDYIPVVVEHSSYTTFHSWYDGIIAYGEKNYTLIPLDFTWDLYNDAFRDGVTNYDELGDTTYHWLNPPPMHVYNDSSLTQPWDIEINYNNTIYNLENILPTFNPVEALAENVVPHPEGFGYIIQDGEMGVYWDDNIGPGGTFACFYNGPVTNKCSVMFRSSIGGVSPNSRVLNQELGSVMGAITEPPSSNNYESVFTESGTSPNYTEDDYNCADIYLNRSLLHFRNLDYNWDDPEGWDWEQRPDIVDEWFGEDSSPSKGKRIFHIREFDINGVTTKDIFYDYEDIPSEVMKKWPMMFTRKEVKQQEKAERRARRHARRRGEAYRPPQPLLERRY